MGNVEVVYCPTCEQPVECDWRCETCGKLRPFGAEDDGADDRRGGAHQ